MCADCHSTAVRKRYDAPTDTFHTTWSEIMVGCEACHGPGSLHAAWADQPAMARPPVENFALLTRTSGLSNRELVDLCAPCHARRAQIADQGVPGTPLLDRYLPVLLSPGTFYPDGQILDEDYEYHSFIQSKMYANNVSCRDCHDVHRAKRRKDGNELCTRCHRADTYDTEAHHFHKKVYKGAPSAGRALHLVPHAGPELHGRPLPARPLHARAPPRPLRRARHPERLQRRRLPRRQERGVGRGEVRHLVRQEAQAALRDGARGRARRAPGARRPSWSQLAAGPAAARDRPRHGARPAGPLPGRSVAARASRGARRRRPADPPHGREPARSSPTRRAS